MAHPFKHLKLIIKHRHRVIANASHMGIFFHALRHDLSKFSYLEFHTSSKYYIEFTFYWKNTCKSQLNMIDLRYQNDIIL